MEFKLGITTLNDVGKGVIPILVHWKCSHSLLNYGHKTFLYSEDLLLRFYIFNSQHLFSKQYLVLF